jgi:hypothetical protein
MVPLILLDDTFLGVSTNIEYLVGVIAIGSVGEHLIGDGDHQYL